MPPDISQHGRIAVAIGFLVVAVGIFFVAFKYGKRTKRGTSTAIQVERCDFTHRAAVRSTRSISSKRLPIATKRSASAHAGRCVHTRDGLWEGSRSMTRRLADYTEAIRLRPKYRGLLYSNRALVWKALRQILDKALADETDAIQLYPKAGALALTIAGLALGNRARAIRQGPRRLQARPSGLNPQAGDIATGNREPGLDQEGRIGQGDRRHHRELRLDPQLS